MTEKRRYVYEFADFRLDPVEKNLFHLGKLVPLKPKAVEILSVLVGRAESTVSKTELMETVWHDAFVEENNLSVNVYELRRAFAALGEQYKFIRTVPRRGFRFDHPVTQVPLIPATTAEPHHDLSRESPSTPPSVRARKTGPLMLIAALAATIVIAGVSLNFASRSSEGRNVNSPEQLAAARGTSSLEAYQLYLRGRELWQTRLNANMEKGLDFFHRAIELDPNFVAPYLGIADSLSMMRNDPEDWRQAEEYARKALAINSGSADAHASLGFILAMNRWQWSEAEAELQNAIALDGNSGKAHQWYATVLEIERRFPEAEIHLKRAIEIEPLSPNYNFDLCELYFFAGRYDEAFEQCRRTNEINPDFPLADARMHIYLQQKRYDEAAQVSLENAMRLGATESEVKRQGWYQAYLKNGFRGWMQYNIDSNKGRSDILLTSYELSLSHAQMGDKEKSLLYLEQCYAGHAFLLPFANARPEYDFLRDDPRFRNMMARIGLPQN